MKILKKWNNFHTMKNEIIKVFEDWQKSNLQITRGGGKDVEEIFGLAYTDTSSLAALWNCQAIAKYKWLDTWEFTCLAYSDKMEMLVIFENDNDDEMYIIIGQAGR